MLARNPDGVFAVEDFTALGAVQAIKTSGKKNPIDIAIAGFANEAFGEYITPSLTTVNQQTNRMDEEAAKLFFKIVNSKSKEPLYAHKLILEPELISREPSVKTKNNDYE